jgi:hypothetical protein
LSDLRCLAWRFAGKPAPTVDEAQGVGDCQGLFVDQVNGIVAPSGDKSLATLNLPAWN